MINKNSSKIKKFIKKTFYFLFSPLLATGIIMTFFDNAKTVANPSKYVFNDDKSISPNQVVYSGGDSPFAGKTKSIASDDFQFAKVKDINVNQVVTNKSLSALGFIKAIRFTLTSKPELYSGLHFYDTMGQEVSYQIDKNYGNMSENWLEDSIEFDGADDSLYHSSMTRADNYANATYPDATKFLKDNVYPGGDDAMMQNTQSALQSYDNAFPHSANAFTNWVKNSANFADKENAQQLLTYNSDYNKQVGLGSNGNANLPVMTSYQRGVYSNWGNRKSFLGVQQIRLIFDKSSIIDHAEIHLSKGLGDAGVFKDVAVETESHEIFTTDQLSVEAPTLTMQNWNMQFASDGEFWAENLLGNQYIPKTFGVLDKKKFDENESWVKDANGVFQSISNNNTYWGNYWNYFTIGAGQTTWKNIRLTNDIGDLSKIDLNNLPQLYGHSQGNRILSYDPQTPGYVALWVKKTGYVQNNLLTVSAPVVHTTAYGDTAYGNLPSSIPHSNESSSKSGLEANHYWANYGWISIIPGDEVALFLVKTNNKNASDTNNIRRLGFDNSNITSPNNSLIHGLIRQPSTESYIKIPGTFSSSNVVHFDTQTIIDNSSQIMYGVERNGSGFDEYGTISVNGDQDPDTKTEIDWSKLNLPVDSNNSYLANVFLSSKMWSGLISSKNQYFGEPFISNNLYSDAWNEAAGVSYNKYVDDADKTTLPTPGFKRMLDPNVPADANQSFVTGDGWHIVLTVVASASVSFNNPDSRQTYEVDLGYSQSRLNSRQLDLRENFSSIRSQNSQKVTSKNLANLGKADEIELLFSYTTFSRALRDSVTSSNAELQFFNTLYNLRVLDISGNPLDYSVIGYDGDPFVSDTDGNWTSQQLARFTSLLKKNIQSPANFSDYTSQLFPYANSIDEKAPTSHSTILTGFTSSQADRGYVKIKLKLAYPSTVSNIVYSSPVTTNPYQNNPVDWFRVLHGSLGVIYAKIKNSDGVVFQTNNAIPNHATEDAVAAQDSATIPYQGTVSNIFDANGVALLEQNSIIDGADKNPNYLILDGKHTITALDWQYDGGKNFAAGGKTSSVKVFADSLNLTFGIAKETWQFTQPITANTKIDISQLGPISEGVFDFYMRGGSTSFEKMQASLMQLVFYDENNVQIPYTLTRLNYLDGTPYVTSNGSHYWSNFAPGQPAPNDDLPRHLTNNDATDGFNTPGLNGWYADTSPEVTTLAKSTSKYANKLGPQYISSDATTLGPFVPDFLIGFQFGTPTSPISKKISKVTFQSNGLDNNVWNDFSTRNLHAITIDLTVKNSQNEIYELNKFQTTNEDGTVAAKDNAWNANKGVYYTSYISSASSTTNFVKQNWQKLENFVGDSLFYYSPFANSQVSFGSLLVQDDTTKSWISGDSFVLEDSKPLTVKVTAPKDSYYVSESTSEYIFNWDPLHVLPNKIPVDVSFIQNNKNAIQGINNFGFPNQELFKLSPNVTIYYDYYKLKTDGTFESSPFQRWIGNANPVLGNGMGVKVTVVSNNSTTDPIVDQKTGSQLSTTLIENNQSQTVNGVSFEYKVSDFHLGSPIILAKPAAQAVPTDASLKINITGNDSYGTINADFINSTISSSHLSYEFSVKSNNKVTTYQTNQIPTNLKNGDEVYISLLCNNSYVFNDGSNRIGRPEEIESDVKNNTHNADNSFFWHFKVPANTLKTLVMVEHDGTNADEWFISTKPNNIEAIPVFGGTSISLKGIATTDANYSHSLLAMENYIRQHLDQFEMGYSVYNSDISLAPYLEFTVDSSKDSGFGALKSVALPIGAKIVVTLTAKMGHEFNIASKASNKITYDFPLSNTSVSSVQDLVSYNPSILPKVLNFSGYNTTGYIETNPNAWVYNNFYKLLNASSKLNIYVMKYNASDTLPTAASLSQGPLPSNAVNLGTFNSQNGSQIFNDLKNDDQIVFYVNKIHGAIWQSQIYDAFGNLVSVPADVENYGYMSVLKVSGLNNSIQFSGTLPELNLNLAGAEGMAYNFDSAGHEAAFVNQKELDDFIKSNPGVLVSTFVVSQFYKTNRDLKDNQIWNNQTPVSTPQVLKAGFMGAAQEQEATWPKTIPKINNVQELSLYNNETNANISAGSFPWIHYIDPHKIYSLANIYNGDRIFLVIGRKDGTRLSNDTNIYTRMIEVSGLKKVVQIPWVSNPIIAFHGLNGSGTIGSDALLFDKSTNIDFTVKDSTNVVLAHYKDNADFIAHNRYGKFKTDDKVTIIFTPGVNTWWPRTPGDTDVTFDTQPLTFTLVVPHLDGYTGIQSNRYGVNLDTTNLPDILKNPFNNLLKLSGKNGDGIMTTTLDSPVGNGTYNSMDYVEQMWKTNNKANIFPGGVQFADKYTVKTKDGVDTGATTWPASNTNEIFRALSKIPFDNSTNKPIDIDLDSPQPVPFYKLIISATAKDENGKINTWTRSLDVVLNRITEPDGSVSMFGYLENYGWTSDSSKGSPHFSNGDKVELLYQKSFDSLDMNISGGKSVFSSFTINTLPDSVFDSPQYIQDFSITSSDNKRDFVKSAIGQQTTITVVLNDLLKQNVTSWNNGVAVLSPQFQKYFSSFNISLVQAKVDSSGEPVLDQLKNPVVDKKIVEHIDPTKTLDFSSLIQNTNFGAIRKSLFLLTELHTNTANNWFTSILMDKDGNITSTSDQAQFFTKPSFSFYVDPKNLQTYLTDNLKANKLPLYLNGVSDRFATTASGDLKSLGKLNVHFEPAASDLLSFTGINGLDLDDFKSVLNFNISLIYTDSFGTKIETPNIFSQLSPHYIKLNPDKKSSSPDSVISEAFSVKDDAKFTLKFTFTVDANQGYSFSPTQDDQNSFSFSNDYNFFGDDSNRDDVRIHADVRQGVSTTSIAGKFDLISTPNSVLVSDGEEFDGNMNLDLLRQIYGQQISATDITKDVTSFFKEYLNIHLSSSDVVPKNSDGWLDSTYNDFTVSIPEAANISKLRNIKVHLKFSPSRWTNLSPKREFKLDKNWKLEFVSTSKLNAFTATKDIHFYDSFDFKYDNASFDEHTLANNLSFNLTSYFKKQFYGVIDNLSSGIVFSYGAADNADGDNVSGYADIDITKYAPMNSFYDVIISLIQGANTLSCKYGDSNTWYKNGIVSNVKIGDTLKIDYKITSDYYTFMKSNTDTKQDKLITTVTSSVNFSKSELKLVIKFDKQWDESALNLTGSSGQGSLSTPSIFAIDGIDVLASVDNGVTWGKTGDIIKHIANGNIIQLKFTPTNNVILYNFANERFANSAPYTAIISILGLQDKIGQGFSFTNDMLLFQLTTDSSGHKILVPSFTYLSNRTITLTDGSTKNFRGAFFNGDYNQNIAKSVFLNIDLQDADSQALVKSYGEFCLNDLVTTESSNLSAQGSPTQNPFKNIAIDFSNPSAVLDHQQLKISLNIHGTSYFLGNGTNTQDFAIVKISMKSLNKDNYEINDSFYKDFNDSSFDIPVNNYASLSASQFKDLAAWKSNKDISLKFIVNNDTSSASSDLPKNLKNGDIVKLVITSSNIVSPLIISHLDDKGTKSLVGFASPSLEFSWTISNLKQVVTIPDTSNLVSEIISKMSAEDNGAANIVASYAASINSNVDLVIQFAKKPAALFSTFLSKLSNGDEIAIRVTPRTGKCFFDPTTKKYLGQSWDAQHQAITTPSEIHENEIRLVFTVSGLKVNLNVNNADDVDKAFPDKLILEEKAGKQGYFNGPKNLSIETLLDKKLLIQNPEIAKNLKIHFVYKDKAGANHDVAYADFETIDFSQIKDGNITAFAEVTDDKVAVLGYSVNSSGKQPINTLKKTYYFSFDSTKGQVAISSLDLANFPDPDATQQGAQAQPISIDKLFTSSINGFVMHLPDNVNIPDGYKLVFSDSENGNFVEIPIGAPIAFAAPVTPGEAVYIQLVPQKAFENIVFLKPSVPQSWTAMMPLQGSSHLTWPAEILFAGDNGKGTIDIASDSMVSDFFDNSAWKFVFLVTTATGETRQHSSIDELNLSNGDTLKISVQNRDGSEFDDKKLIEEENIVVFGLNDAAGKLNSSILIGTSITLFIGISAAGMFGIRRQLMKVAKK